MTFRRARLQFNQRNVGFTLTQEGRTENATALTCAR